MAYQPYVYDELGREYPRKNLYLQELADLDAALQAASPPAELKEKRRELVRHRAQHPHIQELEAARGRQKI